MSFDRKKHILIIGTALAVSFARYLLQYSYPPWHNGIVNFFAAWFIHSFALYFFAGFIWAISSKLIPWLHGNKEEAIKMDDVLVSVAITLLGLSLVVLFLLCWGGSGGSGTDLD